MFTHSLTAKRLLLNVGHIVITSVLCAVSIQARFQDPDDRRRALDLYDANNFVAALPLLEKVAAASPGDTVILSRLGFALYANSVAEKDQAGRQKMRDRARAALLQARSRGDDSNLTKMILDTLSRPDASGVPFSNIKAAEAAIREGEAAFVQGDMDKAIEAYKRALDSDPQLYDAALYAGDVEYKKARASTDPRFRSDHFDAAGVWFTKAVAIDANRETAYRYWGDALDAQGKTDSARDKFVEAVIAEPYNRNAYVGLTQWAERHHVEMGHPKIQPPNTTTSQGGQTTLSIDPSTLGSNDGSNEWLLYNLTRMSWSKGEFFKNYPDEKEYRHSLKEEATAFRLVAEACAKDLKSGKVKNLEASLNSLVTLYDAGLLEPYILFARPDRGIARDYAGYRSTNRDNLRRYWLDIVIVH